MCRRAHIALEAREGLQLFEEPEYHDNLRGLESHEWLRDKRLLRFWKTGRPWRLTSPADGHKDLEDDKSCIKGLMTLGGLESDLHAHLVHSHGVAD